MFRYGLWRRQENLKHSKHVLFYSIEKILLFALSRCWLFGNLESVSADVVESELQIFSPLP